MEMSNQTTENLFDNAIAMEQLESRLELACEPSIEIKIVIFDL
jgi:hypothetical protein